MPSRAKRICNCGQPIDGKRCKKCRPIEHRESSCKRGYDRAWQKFRDDFIAENPLCVDCLANNRTSPTEEVHHIKKLRDHPELRLDPDNCLPLCKPCHSIRTARGE